MDLTKRHCVPCEGGTPPLSDEKENEMLKLIQHDPSAGSGQAAGWILLRDGTHRIHRMFTFKNFKDAIEFVNKVADLAESEGHHPDIKIVYNKVSLDLFTHAVNGLSENDFIMAAKINPAPFFHGALTHAKKKNDINPRSKQRGFEKVLDKSS